MGLAFQLLTLGVLLSNFLVSISSDPIVWRQDKTHEIHVETSTFYARQTKSKFTHHENEYGNLDESQFDNGTNITEFPAIDKYNHKLNKIFKNDSKADLTLITERISNSAEPIPITEESITNLPLDGTINYNKETLPKCPQGFDYLEIANFSVCFLVTKPTEFPPICPYPNNIEYSLLSPILPILNERVWVSAQRNLTNGYGTFEWQQEYFLNYKRKDIKVEGDHYNTSENCLVNHNSQFIPVNCKEKYPSVCTYHYDNHSTDFNVYMFDDYCKKRYNDSCVSNNLSTGPTCYCVASAQSEKQKKETFCTKLVEMHNPSENLLLMKLLSNQRCWVGLDKRQELYQWSSGVITDYTFWSQYTNFTKIHGALDKDGWLLEDDGALNCAICEISVEDHPEVELTLKQDKTTNTISINITNAVEIFHGVTCFAHGSPYYRFFNLTLNTENSLILPTEFPLHTTDYYWCTALQVPKLTSVFSNRVLAPNSHGGYEYVVTVFFLRNQSNLYDLPCGNLETSLYKILRNIRPVKITEKGEILEVLCHITTIPIESSITQEFEVISTILQGSNTVNLSSVQVCLPSTTTSSNQTLHWPETPIGITTIPNELCMREDGTPVTRTCLGSLFEGSFWSDVDGDCDTIKYSPRTLFLDDLRTNNKTAGELNQGLLYVTEAPDCSTTEVHLVSQVLQKLSTFDRCELKQTTDAVNNIMHFDEVKLRGAQVLLNSTDIILCSLDDLLPKTEIGQNGYISTVSEKFVVQIHDLRKTDVIGIKLGESDLKFDPNTIKALKVNATTDNLLKENLDLAMLIPEALRNDIINCPGSETSPNIITSVFYDDVFFTENQNPSNQTSSGRIISVTIPNFNCPFNSPIQVIFKSPPGAKRGTKCASWAYGSEELANIRGHWFAEGNPKDLGSNYLLCEYSHVTHFSLLVLGDSVIPEGHKKALDIITAVSSGLSLFGLLGIFTTAIVFKSYRANNAIAINFSIAMTSQIILLFLADNVANHQVLCVIFGAALHYIVLAQFCWMLTIGILQYQRYVLVFTNPPIHLVAKSCLFSWGLPLIPIAVILGISTDNYGENSNGLCYALGHYFVFGVLLPVCLIILINLLVFLRIMLSIANSRKNSNRVVASSHVSTLQLRLAILLYFLLGITWGFGLLAAIGASIIYSYLFCLTATLQGFVLFLFFIVLNEKTRSMWTRMKTCIWCNKPKSESYNVNSDFAAVSMVRRVKTTNTSESCTDSTTTSEMLKKYQNRSSSDF